MGPTHERSTVLSILAGAGKVYVNGRLLQRSRRIFEHRVFRRASKAPRFLCVEKRERKIERELAFHFMFLEREREIFHAWF